MRMRVQRDGRSRWLTRARQAPCGFVRSGNDGDMPSPGIQLRTLRSCIHQENPSRSRFILPPIDRIMNRLEAMSTLVAVVDAGSLSAAARHLDMPLATVSRKVGELE